MNRDPFLRAALIVALTGFAAALYALFGILAGVVLAAVGIISAVFVSVDYSTVELPEPKPRRESPRSDREGRPEGFERVRS